MNTILSQGQLSYSLLISEMTYLEVSTNCSYWSKRGRVARSDLYKKARRKGEVQKYENQFYKSQSEGTKKTW